MEWLPYGIGGLVLGAGLVWLYGFLLKADAKSKAKLVLDEAQRKAEAAIRDGELKAREVQVNAQAEIERNRSAVREEQHQQTKALDKRQSQLDQQAEDLKKQEAIVQSTQNRLRSKLENATQREKDLNEIFEKQRQQLQRITGLDQAEAERLLADGRFADEVRAAEQHWQQRGIRAVPSMVVNGRHLIQGAQPPAVVLQALRQIAAQGLPPQR